MPLDPTNYTVQLNSHVSVSMADRWAVIGMSGSGKTTWVKQLIPRMLYWYSVPIIVMDTKGQDEFDDIANELVIQQEAPTPPTNPGVFVWKPPSDDINQYELFFSNILHNRAPCMVIIDELSNLGRGNPDSYPHSYSLLLKQGRGLKISTISMVQEYAYIPRQTVGQSTHLMRFHLLNDYDRAKMARMMGIPEREKYMEPPYPYGFYYRRVDKPSPVYAYDNWQEFFTRSS